MSRPRSALLVSVAALGVGGCLGADPRLDIRMAGAVAPSGDAYAIGKAQLAAGNLALAIDALRRATRLDPESSDAFNALGVAYASLGRHDAAADAFAQALAIEPGSPVVLNNWGYSRFQLGDHAGARALLAEAASSADPQARTAAATTLRHVETAQVAADVTIDAVAPTGRIERTNAAEQQLVLDGQPGISGADVSLAAVTDGVPPPEPAAHGVSAVAWSGDAPRLPEPIIPERHALLASLNLRSPVPEHLDDQDQDTADVPAPTSLSLIEPPTPARSVTATRRRAEPASVSGANRVPHNTAYIKGVPIGDWARRRRAESITAVALLVDERPVPLLQQAIAPTPRSLDRLAAALGGQA